MLDEMNEYRVSVLGRDYAGYPSSRAPVDAFPACGTPEDLQKDGYFDPSKGVRIRISRVFDERIYCQDGKEQTMLCRRGLTGKAAKDIFEGPQGQCHKRG